MKEKDGTSKTRLMKANEAVSMFIQERRHLNDYKISGDRVSVIYYSSQARCICDYQELENVQKFLALAQPQFSGTSFSKAIDEIQTVIANNSELNKVILFLSDGQDGSSFEELQQKLKSLQSKFGNKISRWWNIGFGRSADKSVMTAMIDIIKSDKCDAVFKTSLSAEELNDDFIEFACDEKLNF